MISSSQPVKLVSTRLLACMGYCCYRVGIINLLPEADQHELNWREKHHPLLLPMKREIDWELQVSNWIVLALDITYMYCHVNFASLLVTEWHWRHSIAFSFPVWPEPCCGCIAWGVHCKPEGWKWLILESKSWVVLLISIHVHVCPEKEPFPFVQRNSADPNNHSFKTRPDH